MIDELLEMQKDTFRGLLVATWVASLLALFALLIQSIQQPIRPEITLIWLAISPLDWSLLKLARTYLRLSTWIWVCALVALLTLSIHWTHAPDLGSGPYFFTLLVVVSGLLISRNATLVIAGVSSLISVVALLVVGQVTLETLLALVPPVSLTWITAVMMWISSDQLVTAFTWTRNAQIKACIQAETLRLNRDELKKSLLIRDNLNEQLQQAHRQVIRRALQLETAGEVSRRITSFLHFEQLLTEVANLICDQFGYYYAGVFVIDEKEEKLALKAAGGERGPAVLEYGFDLPLDENSVNGYAAIKGETQCVNNVTMWPRFKRVELLQETTSELAIPFFIGQRVAGTLDVQSKRYNAFGKDDIAALQGLAAQVAIAIRNAELYQGELARRRLIENLYDVGRALTSTLNLNEVLDLILRHLDEIVPYDRASVMMRSGDELEIVAARGFPPESHPLQMRVFIQDSDQDIFQQIYHSQQPLVVPDAAEIASWQHTEGVPLARAWLGVPLIHRDEAMGMLSITRETPNVYSDEDAALAATFAGQSSIALENARLYDRITRFNQELEDTVQQRTQDLQAAYDQLERMDRTKSDFISVSSHELRTPLTILRGYSQMLLGDSIIQDNDLHRQLVTGIEKGAVRMHDIVNSMLDVAKIDSRALELYPEPLSLSFLLEPLYDKFAKALVQRKLTLVLKDVERLPAVEADPNALYKVFYHLLENAIKYTPDGGTITVSGCALEASLDWPKGGLEIIVSDTGIGIAPEFQERIFEKFYQTGQVALHSSGTTKFKGGGPGLGLAIARGIVQAHKGKIWVESEGCNEENCPGSQFHIILPLSQGPEKPADEKITSIFDLGIMP